MTRTASIGGTKKSGDERKKQVSYSAIEKLKIIKEIEVGGGKVTDTLAKRWKADPRTLRNYLKQKYKLQQQVAAGAGKKEKLNSSDGLKRLKEEIKKFYQLNKEIPNKDLQLTVTGKSM